MNQKKLKLSNLIKQTFASLSAISINFLPAASVAQTLRLTETTLTEVNQALEKGAVTSEQLVKLYLKRIETYEDQGPKINAIISVNPNAVAEAIALDKERQESGPRGPLHGIPIIVKDNYNTKDIPTTAGSILLDNSLPPDDAFTIKKLRDAGAIIIAKANMSEFAESYGWLGYSSLGGLTLNPYKLTRDPSGSSGGSGAAIAASFALLATGTDTSGSIRGPASVAGIVGIKPTQGLVSRDGIVPLTLSFDSAGPMTNTVRDGAIALGIMAGIDRNDPRTLDSQGKSYQDYTQFLDKDALKGAKIGVVIDFNGGNEEVDALTQQAVAKLKELGAEMVIVDLPTQLENLWPLMEEVTEAEFEPQLENYLQTLTASVPKSLERLINLALSNNIAQSSNALNPGRIRGAQASVEHKGLADPRYLYITQYEFPRVRQVLTSIMESQELDAMIFPTMRCPAGPLYTIENDRTYECNIDDPYTPGYLANVSGFPGISVPMGFTKQGLPVGLTFFGLAYSEPTLLGFAYAYEQATQFRRSPASTPPLPGETINY
ncbi:amidase family protein [Crocosphaera sp.]|uniref:amidase family protein n=1 Tax=Crocosphaera sp. TaxID=2729996 RepID=UPI002606A932|nr:amidase family protein [Crocosphaera sp.]MDJ0580268.1 amidase family protein [Crocosphaera sp.]